MAAARRYGLEIMEDYELIKRYGLNREGIKLVELTLYGGGGYDIKQQGKCNFAMATI